MTVTEGLATEAKAKLAAGDIEGALDCYQQLEMTFSQEPSWSRQVASLHERLGDQRACLAALSRAVERCQARREPLKAVAACKLIRAIDPDNEEAARVLARMLGPRVPSDEQIVPLHLPDDSSGLAVLPLIRSQPRTSDDGLHLLHRGHAVLTGVPLFAELEPEALGTLLTASRLFRMPAGEVLFRQGDDGDQLYVIIEGSVQIRLEDEARTLLATLEENAFFGEIALFTDRPRRATVVVERDVELLEISRDAIMGALHAQPSLLQVLLGFLRQRLVDITVDSGPLFKPLEAEEKRSLAAKFELRDADAGARLIGQGTPSPGLYVLVDGTMSVERETETGAHPIADLLPGDVFGEISTMTLLPAVASVTAKEPCLFLFLGREQVDQTIAQHPRVLAFTTELASRRMTELEGILRTHLDHIHLL